MSEECHRCGVIVGAGLGGGVDDGEDGSHLAGMGIGLVLNKKLFAAEERGTRPIDEIGHMLLGVDQRVIVVPQIFVKPRLARAPILDAFTPSHIPPHAPASLRGAFRTWRAATAARVGIWLPSIHVAKFSSRDSARSGQRRRPSVRRNADERGRPVN
jgi:hypothetical protein